eukprot:scaffold138165_cov145-Phaeocystis_antarctica.AAC.2
MPRDGSAPSRGAAASADEALPRLRLPGRELEAAPDAVGRHREAKGQPTPVLGVPTAEPGAQHGGEVEDGVPRLPMFVRQLLGRAASALVRSRVVHAGRRLLTKLGCLVHALPCIRGAEAEQVAQRPGVDRGVLGHEATSQRQQREATPPGLPEPAEDRPRAAQEAAGIGPGVVLERLVSPLQPVEAEQGARRVDPRRVRCVRELARLRVDAAHVPVEAPLFQLVRVPLRSCHGRPRVLVDGERHVHVRPDALAQVQLQVGRGRRGELVSGELEELPGLRGVDLGKRAAVQIHLRLARRLQRRANLPGDRADRHPRLLGPVAAEEVGYFLAVLEDAPRVQVEQLGGEDGGAMRALYAVTD